jgi:hypothetical protein
MTSDYQGHAEHGVASVELSRSHDLRQFDVVRLNLF